MKIINTPIDGLVLIEPKVFEDARGYFFESFNNKLFKEKTNIEVTFVQDNQSFSQKNVLRGLHFQNPPFTQAKLVRCLKGSVLDVALDLRKNSKTYGNFETTILSEDNKNQLFIPKGFAHGFVVLSETAIFSYKVDNYYNADFESGILWNDPDLKIDWKINKKEIIVSQKDTKLSTFNNFVSPF